MATILMLLVGYILTGAKWFPAEGVKDLTAVVSVACAVWAIVLVLPVAQDAAVRMRKGKA
jgi:hypothetical protein